MVGKAMIGVGSPQVDISQCLDPGIGNDSSASVSRYEAAREPFERLYDDMHVRVFNVAARILGDVDQAADVTQDVFLITFRELPSLPPDVNMERWVYRVAVNVCCDVLRRRRSRGTSSLYEMTDIPDPGDAFERTELVHELELALADLSPRYRTALVLRDLLGLGNGEVADILGISRTNAGVLLFRARAAFRRSFERTYPAGADRIAGLGLAVLLPTLPVPASLQTPPPMVAPSVGLPSLPAPLSLATPAPWDCIASTGSASGAAGVLTKIGAGLAAKAALVALGTCGVAGGGLALQAADRPNGTGAAAASRTGTAVPAAVASAAALAAGNRLETADPGTAAGERPSSEPGRHGREPGDVPEGEVPGEVSGGARGAGETRGSAAGGQAGTRSGAAQRPASAAHGSAAGVSHGSGPASPGGVTGGGPGGSAGSSPGAQAGGAGAAGVGVIAGTTGDTADGGAGAGATGAGGGGRP